MKKVFVFVLLIISAMPIMAVTPALCNEETLPVLVLVKQNMTAEFDRLDTGLKQAAETLATAGMTGSKARLALTKLCSNFDYAVDCATVDIQGRMAAIEPSPYRKYEGKDISGQEQIKHIIKNGRPVLSKVFRAVEGFPAVDVEYPVSDPAGKRLGSVSILFQPEKLLRKIIVPLAQKTPVDIWVMEKGGLILYGADIFRLGLNLFTSARYQPYKGLVRLGRRIEAVPEGNGVYRFRSGLPRKIVAKNAVWKSVSLYGAEWRLVAVSVEHQDASHQAGILIPSADP